MVMTHPHLYEFQDQDSSDYLHTVKPSYPNGLFHPPRRSHCLAGLPQPGGAAVAAKTDTKMRADADFARLGPDE
jgi:hypothetical protein